MLIHIAISWLLEFGPNLVFFLAFHEAGFIAAAKILMAMNLVVLFYTLLVRKHVAIFPLASGALIISFGLLTVYFDDPQWLIIETSLYNGLFASAIFLSLARGKNLLEVLFGELFALSSRGWRTLTLRWGYFFVLQVVGNELVRLTFSTEIWVNYRLVMTFVLLVFGFSQIPMARRERIIAESNRWGLRIKEGLTR